MWQEEDSQYSEQLKSCEEVNFLAITVSNSQRKVNKSTDTKETIGFSQGKLGCIFHVLFVFHYWVKKQLGRWETTPRKPKVERICLKHLFTNSEVRILEAGKQKYSVQ